MRERPHTSYENMNDPCLLDAPATEKAGSDMNPTEKRGAFWSIWRAEKAEKEEVASWITEQILLDETDVEYDEWITYSIFLSRSDMKFKFNYWMHCFLEGEI